MYSRAMKLTIEITNREKWAAIVLASIAATAVLIADALADVPYSFLSDQVLTATALNENFSALNGALSSLEARMVVLEELPPQVDELSSRLGALESSAIALYGEAATTGDSYYEECLTQTGTFAVGACARMAHYACVDRGYISGWFQGDINSPEIGISCLR
jgi:hypothetical protein